MTNISRNIFVWDDKSTWLSTGKNFKSFYTHIRGYHCCRPLDISSYYQDGLLLPSKEVLLERTLYLLKSEKHSKEILIKYYDEAWETYNPKSTIGIMYLGISKEFLIEHCGHYLIYGSELICSIARKLCIEDVLKKQGKPTIFSIDIPISYINDSDVSELEMCIKKNKRYKKPDSIEFGIFVKHSISPDLIVTHEHPSKIHDPFNWGTYYRFSDITQI